MVHDIDNLYVTALTHAVSANQLWFASKGGHLVSLKLYTTAPQPGKEKLHLVCC